MTGRAVFLIFALFCAVAVAGFGRPPVLLVVPAAAFVLLVASIAKLRTAARKIDTIFAEELPETEYSGPWSSSATTATAPARRH
ncbi:hypothetical protein [Amycolatopsis sp. lyj-346]|uniref:hypothetical protein n=1 Tax=Amycolatopsis sp. lyj-346 TaxID=2789289 RepID=UPI00397D0ACF